MMHDNEHNCCGGHSHNHEGGCCGGHSHHEGGCCGGHSHSHEGCGCGHSHHEEEQLMTLLLDNDEEIKCSVIDIFEVEGKDYIALLPVGEDELLLFQYEQNEESFNLKSIETEEEFEKVQKVFFEFLKDDDFEEDYEYKEEN